MSPRWQCALGGVIAGLGLTLGPSFWPWVLAAVGTAVATHGFLRRP